MRGHVKSLLVWPALPDMTRRRSKHEASGYAACIGSMLLYGHEEASSATIIRRTAASPAVHFSAHARCLLSRARPHPDDVAAPSRLVAMLVTVSAKSRTDIEAINAGRRRGVSSAILSKSRRARPDMLVKWADN